jgi:hypothetical protein
MTHPVARLLTVLVLSLVWGAPLGSTPAAAQGCPTFPYTLPDDTPATLVAAINCANNNGTSEDVIDLDGLTLVLTDINFSGNGDNGLPLIFTPITLQNGTITRSSASNFRLFAVTATSSRLTLRNMTLTNGSAAEGAAIYSFGGGTVRVVNSTLSGHTTQLVRLNLPTGTYGYTRRVVSPPLTKPLASVTVSFEARNDTGVMRFDNARLHLIPGAQNSAAPLALPDSQ